MGGPHRLGFLSDRPIVTAVAGSLTIAFSAVFVRLAAATPATVAVFRTAYALPVLGVLAALERRRYGPRPRKMQGLAAIAGIAFAADLIMWHHSIDAVGAGLATVLGNLQVVMVGFAAWLVLGERLERRLLASIPVVVGGVVLVSGAVGAGAFGRDPALGVVFGVGTSVAYSAFILVHREGAKDLRRPATPLFQAVVVTALATALYGLSSGSLALRPRWPSHGWLLLLALGPQVAGWLLLSMSLPRLPAAVSSVLLLLQPAGSLLLGALMLGERPSVFQLAGVALILAGVVNAARRRGGPIGGDPAAIPEPASP